MSNMVAVRSDVGRTLPAEMLAGGARATAQFGLNRLLANGAVLQRGNPSLEGIGDDTTGNDDWFQVAPPVSQDAGSGMSASDIADLIKSTSASLLPALIASHPGVQYTQQANGSIMIYSQPTGTTANLPGTYGNTLGLPNSPGATLTTPGGQLAVNAGGMNLNVLVLGGLGLVALMVMVMGKGK